MRLRKIAALISAVTFAFGLSGCAKDEAANTGEGSASTSESAQATGGEDSGKTADAAESEGVIAGDPALQPEIVGTGAATMLRFGADSAPEGLQQWVLDSGSGTAAAPTSVVKANYVGQVWGNNDTAFDSSFKRGAASAFSLQGVIAGWTQGLTGMAPGAKVILSIPSELGYKDQGTPDGSIKGGDTIAFYVEIEGVYGQDAAGQADAQVAADIAALPVKYSGEIGKPVTGLSVKADSPAPSAVKATVIAKGTGESVPANAQLIVQYAMVSWDNSQSADTYTSIGPDTTMSTSPGNPFTALVGVPVGSRVLLELPQGEGAVPIAAVIDILDFMPIDQ